MSDAIGCLIGHGKAACCCSICQPHLYGSAPTSSARSVAMAEPLQPFNPEAKCPKCGHGEVGVRYVAPVKTYDVRGEATEHPEQMRRLCERCGYGWAEAPLSPEVQP